MNFREGVTVEKRIATHQLELADGRRVKIREYADGSVRLLLEQVGYERYHISEAFIGPGNSGFAIIKLVPAG
jgi:hypothetical protein